MSRPAPRRPLWIRLYGFDSTRVLNAKLQAVVSLRGALRGARPGPLTVELPEAKLDRALYRLDVLLVERVNPGAVTRLISGPLTVTRP